MLAIAYLVDAVRTPRGRGKPHKDALSSVHPQELFATTLAELADRGTPPQSVGDVILERM